jgi:hypothetical protein
MPSNSPFASWLRSKCYSTFGKIFAEEVDELAEITNPTGNEILAVVCGPQGTSRKLKIQNLPAGSPGGPHDHDDRYFTENECDARFAATAHTHAQSDVTGLVASLAAKQTASEKGQANGYAALDGDGKVPTAQLPAPGGANIPAGLIVLWFGLLANIPNGWALCDGENGTPDLRDRFVKGWSDGVDPGGTGGSANHTHADHDPLTHSGGAVADHAYTPQGTNSGGAVSDHSGAAVADHTDHSHGAGTIAVANHADHTHTYSQLVNHTHTVTVNDPGHSHLTQRYPTATGASSGFTIDTSMSGTPADNTLPTKTGTTGISASTANPTGGVAQGTTNGASATLTHSVSGSTAGASATLSHSVTQPANHTFTQPTFNGQAATLQHSVTQPNSHTISQHSVASNEPAYFKLAYIMKL